jgi:hypothetical protein
MRIGPVQPDENVVAIVGFFAWSFPSPPLENPQEEEVERPPWPAPIPSRIKVSSTAPASTPAPYRAGRLHSPCVLQVKIATKIQSGICSLLA